jgi:predicted GNAT superfamily acetyltransferase
MKEIINQFLQKHGDNWRYNYSPFYHHKTGQMNGGLFTFIDSDNESITIFKLSQMEACNGICISSKVEIFEKYRGKGLGKSFCSLRGDLAAHFGYSLLHCTVVDANKPQRKIMAANGFRDIQSFKNENTGNTVIIYTKKISNGEKSKELCSSRSRSKAIYLYDKCRNNIVQAYQKAKVYYRRG